MSQTVATKLVMTAEPKAKSKAKQLIKGIGVSVPVFSAEDDLPAKRNQRLTYVLYLEGNERLATIKHSLERVAKNAQGAVFLYVHSKPNPKLLFEWGALCQQFLPETNRKILFSNKELASVLEEDTAVAKAEDTTSSDDITIESLRKSLGLTQTQLAKIVEVTPRTIQNWESENKPLDVSRSLTDLAELQQIVAHHVFDRAIPDWLNSESEMLGGKKPIELLEHGHTRDLLWQLRSVSAGEPA